MSTLAIADLQTPALLLSRPRLDRNIARMKARMDGFAVSLRPHIKTVKSADVFRLALEGAAGVTVSTLAEAEYAAANRVKNILYAVGMAPAKLQRAAALAGESVNLIVTVDSVDAARAVAQAGLAAVIEIDSDDHRAGVKPKSEDAGEIGRALGGSFRGVMTHAGGSYDCRSVADIRAMAERERRAVVDTAAMLAEAGMASQIVSVGSTPTATFGERFDGVTEARPGVYMFMDLVMAGLGVCSLDDIAISVLASIIGHQRDKNWLLVDAGWMALSRDRGTAGHAVDYGYGAVCDEAGSPLEEFIVSSANQEHGIITRRSGGPIDFSAFSIGRMLRILPNHACATAAQFSAYEVLGDDETLTARWPRINGW
ncbi:MAG: alanine racemase [Amphiplicatus sp.]